MYIQISQYRLYPVAIILTSLVSSLFSPVYAEEKPHTQEFVVTAYYSPLPNQCCYFRGSYEEEITFNGKGTNGADGTGVYPGMIAAPPTYDFGTVIELPGLGVGTVHDRGSRIIEWGSNAHRIDLWVGSGEEGLARAMAWGVRKVTGTVYPLGSVQPPENFSFASISADTSSLASLGKTDTTTLLASASLGENNYSARILQSTLKDLGYFKDMVTGTYGPVTQAALAAFLRDSGLTGDGTKIDELTAAALTVASDIRPENLPDLTVGLGSQSSGKDVRQAQKLLRYLGFYRGRTDGIFDRDVQKSVLDFQRTNSIITKNDDSGAGRIGPTTQAAILRSWKGKIVLAKAKALMEKRKVAISVKNDKLPVKNLAMGDKGSDVKRLQTFLQAKGFLSSSDVTGTFGSRTGKALLAYQIDAKIVKSTTSHGAAVFGPATRLAVSRDLVDAEWKDARANGIGI